MRSAKDRVQQKISSGRVSDDCLLNGFQSLYEVVVTQEAGLGSRAGNGGFDLSEPPQSLRFP